MVLNDGGGAGTVRYATQGVLTVLAESVKADTLQPNGLQLVRQASQDLVALVKSLWAIHYDVVGRVLIGDIKVICNKAFLS